MAPEIIFFSIDRMFLSPYTKYFRSIRFRTIDQIDQIDQIDLFIELIN